MTPPPSSLQVQLFFGLLAAQGWLSADHVKPCAARDDVDDVYEPPATLSR